MLGKKSGQIDIFNSMIYEKLIPKDHLLILVDEAINFSFIYEIVKDKYSDIGRKSSDPEVVSRTTTDVAFRWFLGLNIDDEVPDDTTLSHFRIHRLGNEGLENISNEIVKECISRNLVKKRRYIVDSTDVAANVNYPSVKKILCNSFRKIVKEIAKFNDNLSRELLEGFEGDIEKEHENSEHVSLSKYCEIGKKYASLIYIKTYGELQNNEKYLEAYSIFWDIIEKYSIQGSKDRIISCVDPDARVALKSPGNSKRGYKDHIIVDEDSGIILEATQTPFNVNDDKELINLVNKVQDNFELKPEELSGDKAYGTKDNRKFLLDEEITCNIDFYDIPEEENKRFDHREFKVSKDLTWMVCHNGVKSIKRALWEKADRFAFWFDALTCSKCPYREKCLNDNELKRNKGRVVEISTEMKQRNSR